MKRLLAILAIALMLTGIALSVSADPIGVGGSFTSSAARSGVMSFPGKGSPHGGPFSAQLETLLLSPIGVGGS
jgi:hypothetical protein